MKNLQKHWKNLFIRGVLAFIFGIVALFWPGVGFEILVYYFAFYALIDGIVALIVGMSSRSIGFILEGVVGFAIGLFILFYTSVAINAFLIVVAIWAILTGVLEILTAIELKKHPIDEVWLFIVGVISILFGILVFVNPVVSLLAITIIIGVYALIFGIFLMALGITLRNAPKSKSKSRR